MKVILTLVLLILLFAPACTRVGDDFDAETGQAEAMIGLGRPEDALVRFRAIADHFKGDARCPAVLLRISEISSTMLDDKAAAMDALDRILHVAPLSEAGRVAAERRARLRGEFRDYQGAIEDYVFLIKHFPENAMTYRTALSSVYITAKDFRQSRIEIKPLIEGREVPPEFREKAIFLAAESFFLEGQAKKAAGYYEWLIHDFPDSPLVPEAKLHLATCIEELGYLGVARGVTKDAGKDYPNKGVIEARLKSIDERGKKPARQMQKELAKEEQPEEGAKKVYKEDDLN